MCAFTLFAPVYLKPTKPEDCEVIIRIADHTYTSLPERRRAAMNLYNFRIVSRRKVPEAEIIKINGQSRSINSAGEQAEGTKCEVCIFGLGQKLSIGECV